MNKDLAEKIRRGLGLTKMLNKKRNPLVQEERKVWGVEKIVRRSYESYGANVVGLALLGSGCSLEIAATLCKRATDMTLTQDERDGAKDEIFRRIGAEEVECERIARLNLRVRSSGIATLLDSGDDPHIDAA